MPASTYLRSYRKNGIETDLSVADGHRVIQLLYQGLIDCIVRAKASIENNDINQKAKQIDKAAKALANKEVFAIVIEKDTFEDYGLQHIEKNNLTMGREEAIQTVKGQLASSRMRVKA